MTCRSPADGLFSPPDARPNRLMTGFWATEPDLLAFNGRRVRYASGVTTNDNPAPFPRRSPSRRRKQGRRRDAPAGMRAVRFDHYGDVDVLDVLEVDQPEPGVGQVRVAVRAAGIN